MDNHASLVVVPSHDSGLIRSTLGFPVVGLGASAGGLSALIKFFENIPDNSGMAFVVVLHLSPTHESNVDAILQRVTAMPVLQVMESVPIEANHIYVIAPDRQLTVSDNILKVNPQERPPGRHVVVDLFFRSLAEARRERAMAVVLSGTGCDGSGGVPWIKEQGGIIIAQDPEDAEHDEMPQAAIDTGTVDFVLPATEIPRKLLDIWQNAQALQLPADVGPNMPHAQLAADQANSEEALQQVLALLRERTGHDFRHYKRATMLRRIERRMQVRAVQSLTAYRDVLQKDPAESAALLKDMLIAVTNFFRDRDAFEALEREVVPELFRNKGAGDALRVWVPACSSGEEAYSIAMLFAERSAAMPAPPQVNIFASDIDDRAIAVGRAGLYPASILTDVPPGRLRQFFNKEQDRYRVRKGIRDKVMFAAHNILRDPPFSKVDLISCRNLLIYLNRDVQSHVLEMFHFALNPGGYLFLGSSESADGISSFFEPVNKKARIYRAKPVSRPTRFAPPMALRIPGRLSEGAEEAPRTRRQFSFAEVHQRVLAQFAPPSVIVNAASDIVHMSDRVGRFLRHVAGEPSSNVVSLVLPELRLELRTALHQAQKTRRSVEARRVELERDGGRYYINMILRPFHDDAADADLVLVMFDEVEQTMSPDPDGLLKKDAVLGELEEELQRTKEQLQETIEQSEVSTEELRASNEELQAINEELRSATEELETSKEELQSVNEELVTVNFELKMKVEEAGKVNDDLNNLIASTDIATLFVDAGMRIKRYTPRVADIFSIIPTDIGRSILDLTHRLDYPELGSDIAGTFDTLHSVEREISSNDGRFYIARLLPYRTTEDRIAGAVLTFFDITRRHKAEEDVRAGEERIKLAAESTKDYAIMTTDADGMVTSWNQGAQLLFGYTEKEMMGCSADVLFVPEDRAASIPAGERQRARDDGRVEDERWYVSKVGRRLFCNGVVTPIINAGEFLGFAKISRDQTDRIRWESQLNTELGAEKAGRQQADMRNDMRDEFLAVLAHELRHPLNLININAELLARLPEARWSARATQSLDRIRGAVLNQAKLIEDLMDLSRLRHGKLAMSIKPVELGSIADATVEAMRADPAAANLTLSLQRREPVVMVSADRVRIEQVLMNLITNAVKFTPANGRVQVEIGRDGDEARIDVSDTGRGIDAEVLPHVFDMFAQGNVEVARAGGGLGIGLALVRQLVQLHGGRVRASSAGHNRGAKFSVWLPLYDKGEPEAPGEAAPPGNSLSGVRILVVDDMVEAAEILQSLFQLEGAQTDRANSAEQAMAMLAQQPYDLLVSDISMPKTDGVALLLQVREHYSLPAIAVSGRVAPDDIKRIRASGFVGVLAKPIDPVQLFSLAREAVGPGKGGAAAADHGASDVGGKGSPPQS